MWIWSLLQERKILVTMPPILHCDNTGATYMTSNPIFHARTKHIKIGFHFAREQVTMKLFLH